MIHFMTTYPLLLFFWWQLLSFWWEAPLVPYQLAQAKNSTGVHYERQYE